MSPWKFFPLSFRACIFHHHSLLNNILSSWLINYFNFVFILQIPNIAIIFNFRKFKSKGIANFSESPILSKGLIWTFPSFFVASSYWFCNFSWNCFWFFSWNCCWRGGCCCCCICDFWPVFWFNDMALSLLYP